jgi:hypothetical protein
MLIFVGLICEDRQIGRFNHQFSVRLLTTRDDPHEASEQQGVATALLDISQELK